MANGARTPIDPRLIALVVAGVTVVFILTAVVAVIRNQTIDSGWFMLMGGIAGGVLSYGVVTRR